jgi:hypothetical protein
MKYSSYEKIVMNFLSYEKIAMKFLSYEKKVIKKKVMFENYEKICLCLSKAIKFEKL